MTTSLITRLYIVLPLTAILGVVASIAGVWELATVFWIANSGILTWITRLQSRLLKERER